MENFTITLALIVVTGLISWQSFNNFAMREKLLFEPYKMKRERDFFRFITHGFIHADIGHLLINMLVLYQFGEAIEIVFGNVFAPGTGRLMYLFMYLSAIVVSSIPDYLKHQDNYAYGALGASGATSAMVFSYILFSPWDWFMFPPMPALVFGILYLIYSNYMARRGGDNIGHNAHFWGAVYGLAFTLGSMAILRPEMISFFWARLMQGPQPFPGFG
jgi:membrane associated rhomboid family serine protease